MHNPKQLSTYRGAATNYYFPGQLSDGQPKYVKYRNYNNLEFLKH